jgi:hypothetical protein
MFEDDAEKDVGLDNFSKIAVLHQMKLQEHPYKLRIRGQECPYLIKDKIVVILPGFASLSRFFTIF